MKRRQINLTAKDHTRIMDACMKNAIPLFKYLGGRQLIIKRKRPDWKAVLQALPKVASLDARTKKAVAEVLKRAPVDLEIRKKLPGEVKKATLEILAGLETENTIEGMIRCLKSIQREKQYRSAAVINGIGLGIQILEDGRDTIYSPHHPFNATFLTATEALGELGGADLRGFVRTGFSFSGAVVGSAAAGIGMAAEALCAD